MAYSQATYQQALAMVQTASPEQLSDWVEVTAFDNALLNAGYDPTTLDPAQRDQLIVLMLGYLRSRGS